MTNAVVGFVRDSMVTPSTSERLGAPSPAVVSCSTRLFADPTTAAQGRVVGRMVATTRTLAAVTSRLISAVVMARATASFVL